MKLLLCLACLSVLLNAQITPISPVNSDVKAIYQPEDPKPGIAAWSYEEVPSFDPYHRGGKFEISQPEVAKPGIAVWWRTAQDGRIMPISPVNSDVKAIYQPEDPKPGIAAWSYEEVPSFDPYHRGGKFEISQPEVAKPGIAVWWRTAQDGRIMPISPVNSDDFRAICQPEDAKPGIDVWWRTAQDVKITPISPISPKNAKPGIAVWWRTAQDTTSKISKADPGGFLPYKTK